MIGTIILRLNLWEGFSVKNERYQSIEKPVEQHQTWGELAVI